MLRYHPKRAELRRRVKDDSLGRWVQNGDSARDVHRVRRVLPGYVTSRAGVRVSLCAGHERV